MFNRIWNVPTAQTIQMLRIHDGPITGLSLHATGTPPKNVEFKKIPLELYHKKNLDFATTSWFIC